MSEGSVTIASAPVKIMVLEKDRHRLTPFGARSPDLKTYWMDSKPAVMSTKPYMRRRSSEIVNINWKDFPITMLDVYHELIQEGLHIWIFSGDTDAVIPITSTRYSIDALKIPTVKPWRA